LNHVVIIGAGLAGCVVSMQLVDHGFRVTMIEKSHRIGGKVRLYGCKAVDKCQNCGVCLTAGLWDKVSEHPKIDVILNSTVNDITGKPGSIIVSLKNIIKNNENLVIENVSAVVICTGFEESAKMSSFHLHIKNTTGLLTGIQIEEAMLNRTSSKLFESVPKSVAFIQCLGSRDQNEGALYCSRVCCSYSTRAAKVIREYYPECEITFFYMELQNVESGNFYTGLRELGIDFIKCRPLKILGGNPVAVEYDDPAEGIKTKNFDMVVLSEGIHANNDNDRLAEIYGLRQNQDGFLQTINTDSGIYIAGCAKSPMKIDETYADAVTTTNKLMMNLL